ncbi:MAG: porin family protein [Bacteriovoracaceae bacterium]|nr:porin family protein [Bacteriovoracaceae bacterium]
MKHIILALFLTVGLSGMALAKSPKKVQVEEEESIEVTSVSSSSEPKEKIDLNRAAIYGGLDLGTAIIKFDDYNKRHFFLNGRPFVGYRFSRFLRADASFDWLWEKKRVYDSHNTYFYGYNLNVYGQYPLADFFVPYLGLGLGWLHEKVKDNFFSGGEYKKLGGKFHPIFTCGLDVFISNHFSIGAELRYQKIKLAKAYAYTRYEYYLYDPDPIISVHHYPNYSVTQLALSFKAFF